ncbi:tRNA dihydrouridine(20/20a) synthase DusA [Marivibrio halodurans]|uniref:tRNA-dihydrouridine(20/20a) synthase n=1 Tax=Marivibrio halodurans TaxID=2039722 RepID=A0A8J7SL66_9PROT|nr:tRNA dihydrouridine(20/20a) synthase DusA [Marivibrio halodurans]MBP5858908.1 tRNA dihydrouridine(20/20a) synthase DusA [Marivibrio halodurans]
MTDAIDPRLSVAPMMDWTDRYDRYFLRLISGHALLYTEMVTAQAILHGDRDRLLGFDPAEHPVACQLGGSDPVELAEASAIAAGYGYDELNLNVGCPSDRVRNGRFGACLMAEPDRVRDCIAAMRGVVDIPVTVKSRIGIDGREEYEDLLRFVDTVAESGCRHFIVHARIAILAGLSPKENREIPPLRYDVVKRLKAERPELSIVLNGGVKDLATARDLIDGGLDGVMIGRAAYQDPYMLAEADRVIFDDMAAPVKTRGQIVADLLPYVRERLGAGVPLHHITRHILGLFNGRPGGRKWRRYLSENAYRAEAGAEVIEQAAALVPDAVGPGAASDALIA